MSVAEDLHHRLMLLRLSFSLRKGFRVLGSRV